MDLTKKEEQQPLSKKGKTPKEHLKDAVKLAGSLMWIVTSRVLLFGITGLVVNVILVVWLLVTRDSIGVWTVLIPVLASILMTVGSGYLGYSFGVSSAIEHIWNEKKHHFFDYIAEKIVSFLVKKNMPLTSESTWLWLAERPFAMLDSAPSPIKTIARKFFEQLTLSKYLRSMADMKPRLSEDPQQTALVLSEEIQKHVNPFVIETSYIKIGLLIFVNVLIFVLLSFVL